MPTYAVLGGTGNIGSEIIKHLDHETDTTLHIYARSRERLINSNKKLADPASRHRLYTGSLTDTNLFAACIDGCSVVFGVVGTNANNPDVRLAQDLAASIIGAMTQLRAQNGDSNEYRPPTVIFVTSAGMALDRRAQANFPRALLWFLHRVAKFIYADFEKAIALFRRAENSWVPVVFVCAPGITFGPTQGRVGVAMDMPRNAPLYVTYTDLAVAMVQMGQEVDEAEVPVWVGHEVGVVGARQPPVGYGSQMYYLTTGLLCTWAPPIWRVGYRRGWWGHK